MIINLKGINWFFFFFFFGEIIAAQQKFKDFSRIIVGIPWDNLNMLNKISVFILVPLFHLLQPILLKKKLFLSFVEC